MAADTLAQYREFLIVLAAAGLVVPLFLRIGINSVLAFLIVGILLSPDVLGPLAARVPALAMLMMGDSPSIVSLAELGVVFLLFLIGLELSFERLMTMRRMVLGLGGLQVVVTTAITALAAWGLGLAYGAALTLGAALSLSSTAIVVQLLSDAKRLGSHTGRASFAVLLAQDLAVIPLLLLVGILGRNNDGPVIAGIALALAQAVLAIAVIVLVGRFALRPLLRLVAGTRSSDLFMAAVLLIAVGTGVAANLAGLSMALGAFIAGLMLAETEYRRAIEAIIEPFKGLLLGAFFLLLGLGLDLDGLFGNPLRIAAIAVAVIALKSLIIYGLARIFRVGRAVALETALLLGPCGEFAFVILAAAAAAKVLGGDAVRDAQLIVTLTMIVLPILAHVGRRLALELKHRAAVSGEAATPLPADHQPRVIVAGFGRVGHLIGAMLDEHKIAYIAVDADADLVARERRNGFPVYYGDATNPEFLRKCGIAEATALAVTMDHPLRVDEVTRIARAERIDLKIIARARDERHAARLYAAGVTEAVPETIESSLQLGEALLVEAGIPVGLAIASVHERRDGFRKLLGRPSRREAMAAADLKKLRSRRKPLA
ncbi:MAG: cation:proton antiporter [Rhizobiales bacterium]|nr:cation:proton antiporter [Hyphomicrobiales bacterium]MBI3672222.1 cation:proton antiporter [Hyphomicrobiales bacterium]